MLGQIKNQPENHQFDVCGRVYYTDVCYDNGKGELVAETVNATSHDDAESVFRSNLLEPVSYTHLTLPTNREV